MSTNDTDKPAPKLSSSDRLDATTREAQAIIDRETALRDAKTMRLRGERLARDAANSATAQRQPNQAKTPRAAKAT